MLKARVLALTGSHSETNKEKRKGSPTLVLFEEYLPN